MTARVKIQEALETPQSKEEVDAAIRQIGDLLNEIDRLENNLEGTIRKETASTSKKVNAHEQRIIELQQGIEAFMASHRRELTQGGKRKSIKLPTGNTGWRFSTLLVEITGEEEEVVKLLEKRGLEGLVRVKKTVDKEAIKKNPGSVRGIKGLIVKKGEEIFWIKPDQVNLKTEIADDGQLVRRKTGSKKKES